MLVKPGLSKTLNLYPNYRIFGSSSCPTEMSDGLFRDDQRSPTRAMVRTFTRLAPA
jgi:hypothetical protein